MHKKLLAGLGAIALSVTMAVGTAAPAQAAPPSNSNAQELAQVTTSTITQTFTYLGETVTFAGTFTPTGFASSGGDLTVEGLLNGTVTNAADEVLATVTNQAVSTTAVGALATEACQILNLDLGPLELNVLGLVVNLSDVQLDITAVPGQGNLLGNLLCAVAGLLDQNGGGLGNLLNRLLGL
jgi:hypothetical protein